MKLKNIHISHGRYYRVAQNKWIPLSRVADGLTALQAALDAIDRIAQQSGMQRAVTDYLAVHLPKLTPAVRTEHARIFKVIADDFADFDVSQVRPRHCEQFLSRFASAPSACKAYKYRLSAFFSWCVRQELCDLNPLREITVADPPRHRTAWTPALFAAVGARLDPMMRVYHHLSYLLFQRTTDLRLLERNQINDGHIHFRPGKTAHSSGAEVRLTVTPQIAAELATAARLSAAAGIVSPYVIHTSTGHAYTRSGIYSAYRRADTALHGRATGLNPKDLRPFASVEAEHQGYTVREIQRHMAHAKQGTTEIYLAQHDVPVSDISLRLPENS